jgi:hypothetical protein
MQANFIKTLNPQFQFGYSLKEYCDCLGLVILMLKSQNKICNFEPKINRYYTSLDEVKEQLLTHKFFEIEEVDKIVFPVTCLIETRNNRGHLGIYFPEDKTIYSMVQSGIVVQEYNNEKLYYYQGE